MRDLHYSLIGIGIQAQSWFSRKEKVNSQDRSDCHTPKMQGVTRDPWMPWFGREPPLLVKMRDLHYSLIGLGIQVQSWFSRKEKVNSQDRSDWHTPKMQGVISDPWIPWFGCEPSLLVKMRDPHYSLIGLGIQAQSWFSSKETAWIAIHPKCRGWFEILVFKERES